jgi:zinc/manganese transport system permease protein
VGTRAAVVAVRGRGVAALRPAALVIAAVVALAGLLLALFPAMDHLWLDALERVAPPVQEAFLTPTERAARRETLEALARGEALLAEARALQQDVQWGTRTLDADRQERLRQFLAGRSELTAGDRMVLRTLRGKARQRQRYWLGVPLVVAGAALAAATSRRSRSRGRSSARGDRPSPSA